MTKELRGIPTRSYLCVNEESIDYHSMKEQDFLILVFSTLIV